MDMAILSAGRGLAKASEIIDALLDSRDKAIFEAAIGPVNKLILSAQRDVSAAYAEQLSLLKDKSELEKQIANLEAWATEKQRYELKEVVLGCFAYSLKESAAQGEPIHLICANCYQSNKKRLLQRRNVREGRETHLDCPDCGGTFKIWGGGVQNVPS